MYSHGSSARVGVGKRGHGGRNYRPPKPRRDVDSTPPPLKQCRCLLQLDVPEYLQRAATGDRRQHVIFGGRDAMVEAERQVRSLFQCHLQVPGRNQAGPIAVAGKNHRDTLAAASWLLTKWRRKRQASVPIHSNQQQQEEEELESNPLFPRRLAGRIQRHVQDPRDPVLEGQWILWSDDEAGSAVEEANPAPLWMFWSDTIYVLHCPTIDMRPLSPSVLAETGSTSCQEAGGDGNENNHNPPTAHPDDNDETKEQPASSSSLLTVLLTSIENWKFQVGETVAVTCDMFVHEASDMALAMGPPQKLSLLFHVVQQALQTSHPSTL